MNADTIVHMFEMFSRGNRDSAHHQGGLGIGLALSRRLAQMHGGTLEARSEGLSQGSTFTVLLPLAGGVADAQAGGDWPSRQPEPAAAAAALRRQVRCRESLKRPAGEGSAGSLVAGRGQTARSWSLFLRRVMCDAIPRQYPRMR